MNRKIKRKDFNQQAKRVVSKSTEDKNIVSEEETLTDKGLTFKQALDVLLKPLTSKKPK